MSDEPEIDLDAPERPMPPRERIPMHCFTDAQLAKRDAAIEARVREHAAADGYAVACAVLRGVAQRTGSPAARWAADYLEADPDRQAP